MRLGRVQREERRGSWGRLEAMRDGRVKTEGRRQKHRTERLEGENLIDVQSWHDLLISIFLKLFPPSAPAFTGVG